MSDPVLFGIYIARFPFLDNEEGKVRPVIVVSKSYGRPDVIAIIPISSTAISETVDTVLSEWKQEGLLRPSVARVHRLTTMLQADLLSELGVLSPDDIQNLGICLRSFLQL